MMIVLLESRPTSLLNNTKMRNNCMCTHKKNLKNNCMCIMQIFPWHVGIQLFHVDLCEISAFTISQISSVVHHKNQNNPMSTRA
jgi:hypothetical protein